MSEQKRPQVYSFPELVDRYILERTSPSHEPVRLGFGTIDVRTRGVSIGQTCIIAARTGVGKTFALASVLHNACARRDAGCLVLSLEMPGVEWTERQLAMALDVAPETVEMWARHGELRKHLAGFLSRVEHARLVEDAVRLDQLSGVFASARDRLAVPLRLVLIDYLGLLGASGSSAYERASMIGKALKDTAKAEQVAIIVAAQVSRDGGDGSEPVSLSMLRDSGVIEEASDYVLGCWQPGRAKDIGPIEAEQLRDVMRIALLKNRRGMLGDPVDLVFREKSRRLVQSADPFATEDAR